MKNRCQTGKVCHYMAEHFKKANDNLITCKTCRRWESNFLCRHFDEKLFSLWTRARFTILIKISRVTSWRNESSRRTFTDNKTKTCSNRYHVCKCTLSNAVFPRFLPAQMENYVKHLKKLKTKNLERCFLGLLSVTGSRQERNKKDGKSISIVKLFSYFALLIDYRRRGTLAVRKSFSVRRFNYLKRFLVVPPRGGLWRLNIIYECMRPIKNITNIELT